MWGYPYEDHGDPSVDDRWRRALTREDARADMGFPLARYNVHTPIDDLLDSALLSVDELLEDIARHGA